MDRWNQVLSITDNWQLSWGLNPSVFEMIVEDSFTLTVSDTGTKDVDLQERLGLWSRKSQSFKILMVHKSFVRNS